MTDVVRKAEDAAEEFREVLKHESQSRRYQT